MTVPAIAFSHLGLHCRDLELMEDFYGRVMGFTVTDRGNLDSPSGRVSLVFLSRDPTEHHQLLLVTGRPDEAHYNVINQISFRVGELAALRHFQRALQNERTSELTPLTHGNAISLYFRDPEGHRVEVFFDTPWYCTQPCREPIDLSRSDAEILARTETLARTLPGFTTRAAWSAEMRRKMSRSEHFK